MKNFKSESYEVRLASKTTYFKSTEGKKAFCKAIVRLQDKKGNEELLTMMAFENWAELLKTADITDRLLVNGYRDSQNNFIAKHIIIKSKPGLTSGGMSLKQYSDYYKEQSEKNGLVAIDRLSSDGSSRSFRLWKKDDCVQLSNGSYQPKIDFICSKLGGKYVTEKLQEKLGEKFSKMDLRKYGQVKEELLEEALLFKFL